jgi:hypothetical protein
MTSSDQEVAKVEIDREKIKKAARYIIDHSWNDITPKKLMERFDLSWEEFIELCKTYKEITVLVVSQRKPRQAVAEIKHRPAYSLDDTVFRKETSEDIMRVFSRILSVMKNAGIEAMTSTGPEDLKKLMMSEWPEFWWDIRCGEMAKDGRYTLKIEAEWEVGSEPQNKAQQGSQAV